MQEMKIVLRAMIERYRLSPPCAAPEHTARRSITFSPGRAAHVVLHAAARAGARHAPPAI